MANQLITLDEYKTYKGIRSVEKDDQIRFIISAVNSFVKNYCNRTFVDQYDTGNELTTYFDGTGTNLVYLDECPLINVATVSTSIDGGITQELLVEDTDYYVDMQEGTIQTVSGSVFVLGATNPHKTLEVVYLGGYEVAPDDLKIACLDLVEYYKEESYTPKKSLKSSETTQFITKELPPHIKRVFDLYRVIY